MMHLRGGGLALVVALLSAACVVNSTPLSPTAALITATALPTSSAAPASATAINIITATPTSPPPIETPGAPTAVSSSTAAADIASSTPIASETAAAATATGPTSTPAPIASPAPTRPPQATALPVGIQDFRIEPQTINPGDSVTLTWQATGQQAALYRLEPGGPLTDMHDVPLSGTLTLKTPDGLRNRVDYVLFVGAGGSTAQSEVSAVIRCPDTWFFANPPPICPQGPGALAPMASEHFERGLMLWLSGRDQIYILFGDGNSPRWSTVANLWRQGQPESDPSLTPPAGLYQPVRGFGVAWRPSAGAVGPSVRDRLGWASEPETALTGSYQCDSSPKYTHCYISGPGGGVYHLKPEFSGWEVWQGP